jgi:hypothetical protein
MIIHSDVFTYRHFEDAAAYAGVKIVDIELAGSRSRDRAWKFYLSGSSNFNPGFGRTYPNGEKAATWDEWGIFFARLFMIDPNAHCGKHGYQGEDHYHWRTGDRFRTLHPRHQHKRHKWGLGRANVTGVYSVAECDCGAIQRWFISPSMTWEQFNNN